jgi:hypothetical protein
MKTPHSKGSHDQLSIRCQRSLRVSKRRISVSCEEVGISGGGIVPSGTGLRAVRRGWRLPCPRTSRRHRPAAMPSTTRGRVTVRPRAPAARPSVFSSSVNRERARSPSADSRSAPLVSPSAPAFQMTRYYRYGELDTCDGRWAAIWACMDRSKRYVRLDRRRNISTARLVRVRSQNSTRTKKLTPSRFPRLTQGRPGAEREGTGARAGGSGAGEAVLDPDGPRGGGAAVAETVRR